MKTLYFKDTDNFIDSVLGYYEDYEEKSEEFLGVSVVASYKILIEMLNYIVKNTSFTMKNIHLEDGECADYWDEWILTIDSEGQIWVQVAKYETGYVFTEENAVFVHGDVNSAFAKKNEKENLIVFEIGEKDRECADCKNDKKDSHIAECDTDDGVHVTVKCNLDATEALKIVENMEKRINRMNDAFAEMDRFRRMFRW